MEDLSDRPLQREETDGLVKEKMEIGKTGKEKFIWIWGVISGIGK